MRHDFAPKHGGNGGPCDPFNDGSNFGGKCGPCDGKGIMSYGEPPLEWSTCSKSDWEKEYSQSNWGNGCLDDISGMVSNQKYFYSHNIINLF